MIDPFKNLAILPASCVFDAFMARLDEVGSVSMGKDGMFSIPSATLTDYKRHYSGVLSGMVKSLSRHAKRIVFVDECLPQNCTFHGKLSRKSFADPDNVVRWEVDDRVDIPVDDINHMMLSETGSILAKSRKVIYLANRTLCEKYLADGVRFVIGQRLIAKDYKYVSTQWKPVLSPPDGYVGKNLPDEPFTERNEALNYLWSRLTD